MQRYIVLIAFLFVCVFLLFTCREKSEPNPYRNINNTDATYVGMSECRQCHEAVYQTFKETGMGKSWDLASKEKSSADFSDKHAPVYDSILNFYYKAFWKDTLLYIKEYRLDGKDTTHYREQKIDYIVGSGQHTNSHLFEINGYLHQAPITFYTQKGKWDLAPGFEDGSNTRFDRKIETECITCHNGYPKHVEGSLNKYTQVQRGIDCERCHGPGSLHVAEKRSGKIIDTSKGPDYSIVNPRRLSTDQQNDLCQRCHLQGIAVLNDGKTFFDFEPTEKLSNTQNVFMPSFSGSQKHMIMASHVERMKMSDCFVNSGKMSCITCHNPHVSVKATPKETYKQACNSCHGTKDQCTETMDKRNAKNDNCYQCHMPQNGSIDIPHVAVTDHFIRKNPQIENIDEIRDFIGLSCYNNPKPDNRTMARGFLEFYERYQPNSKLLDSALAYLDHADERTMDNDKIRAYFLQNQYQKIIDYLPSESSSTNDAWTAYRIGESFLKNKQAKHAVAYLNRAVELKPLALDFQYKLANAYIENNNLAEAEKTLLFIINEYRNYEDAYVSLGFVALQKQQFAQAVAYSKKAIALNPDAEQAYINLAAAFYQQQKMGDAQNILKRGNKLFPENQQMKLMLADLNK